MKRARSDEPSGAANTIVKFELFKVAPRWVFLRLEDSTGIVGWGEPNLEGWSSTVMTAVEEMMPSVMREDCSRIEYIHKKLVKQKFYAGGPVLQSALAGIDQALWDILGKRLGVPVHTLLGGAVRDRLKVYRWCGGDDNSPAEAAAEAKRVLATSNYKQLKMNACPRMGYIDTEGAVRAAVARMKAVREAVGEAVEVGLDFHGRVKVPMAKQLMAQLAPFHPLFFEEVVGGEANNAALPALASASCGVPLATGERMFTVAAFRDLLEKRCVDILQPDCSHAGGISTLLTIARMGEAYDVSLAPHCPLGPIALASCLQVDACAINFAFPPPPPPPPHPPEGVSVDLLDYVSNKSAFDVDAQGYLSLPMGPGLGIEIDEVKVREMAKLGHGWRDREWVLEDGTPTTW
jgi:galactonate dehydratase